MGKTIKATPKKNVVKSKKNSRTPKANVDINKFSADFFRQFGAVMSRLAHE